MARLAPFRALRYDTAAVGDLSRVVAPPYDVITPADQDLLYAAHPRNIVRLILGRESGDEAPGRDRYERAATHLATWRREGTLAVDPRPGLYPYSQRFRLPGGEERVREGLIAILRLESFGAGVRAHERTLSAPKEDRFQLLQATATNLSQIFMLYEDPHVSTSRSVEAPLREARGRPVAVAEQAGVVHTLWQVDDPGAVREVVVRARGRALTIADGHHRYETALRYRDEMRSQHPGAPENAAFEYITVFLCAASDPGLVILPTHRLVQGRPGFDAQALRAALAREFDLEEVEPQPDAIVERLARVGRTSAAAGSFRPAFALVCRDLPRAVVAALKPDGRGAAAESPLSSLDVVVLEERVLTPMVGISREEITRGGRVGYSKDAREAIDLARVGRCQAAFLLNPTRIEQVIAVSAAGERMPQKSTFFTPKILSGLVLRVIDPAESVSEP